MELPELLERHRPELQRFLERNAGGLLRHEGVEDLVQGTHLRAIQSREHFRWQGDAQFLGWLHQLARQHISDRHAYWSALKRSARRMLRVRGGDASTIDGSSSVQLAGSITGPMTFAERRELVGVSLRALATLPPRDQDLVRWMSEGATVQEMAGRLGISAVAAERAKQRAVDRFRRAFAILSSPSMRRQEPGTTGRSGTNAAPDRQATPDRKAPTD